MRVQTNYIAYDGRVFYTEKECRGYEEKQAQTEQELNNAVDKLRRYCATHECENCIFSKGNGECKFDRFVPKDWE